MKFLRIILSSVLIFLSVATQTAFADSGDIFTALAGLIGTAGMYGAYLSAILEAGNNAYYQEETRLYDVRNNGVDKNPADHLVVDSVMKRLRDDGNYVLDVRSLPFRWNVSDNTEFNAACFPANYITVNKGLVRGLNGNEDEIAAVLAHEMTHGIKLHSAYNYARAAAQSFGITFLGMVAGRVSPDVVGVIADYSVAKNVILPAEYEADEGGFYLAASAGFNPGGAAAAMARMDYITNHPDTFDRSYGADPYDHPDTDKREMKLSQMMTAYSAGHVTVKNRSEIYIDDNFLLKAKYSTEIYDDTPEQAYLIAGGLARAFHEYDSAEGWSFRPGVNGRIDFLSSDGVYSSLKKAVESAHAEERLIELLNQAYNAEKSSGARVAMAAEENQRNAVWQERRQKNAQTDAKLIGKFYENADAYNDVYRPAMSLAESARSFDYDADISKRALIYATRARAKSALGDFTSALQDADYAVSIGANEAYVYLNRADVFRAMGKPEEALAEIQKTISLDPNASPAYKMAADIEDELGLDDDARGHYARLHELVPEADIPEKYLKIIDPKLFERLEKQREAKKKEQEKMKAEAEREKRKAEEKEAKKKSEKEKAEQKAASKKLKLSRIKS